MAPLSCLPALLFLLLSYILEATGTGRMLNPPQRSSLWRDPVHKRNPLVVKNHQDHTLNCGGLWKQKQNDGRCGVCGDPWNLPPPRPNEAGGTYGRGIIGRTFYPTDRFIPVMIQVLASIDGYFEFKLCPNNNVKRIVTQKCLDKNPLKIYSNDRWTAYGTRYYPNLAPNKPENISLALEIPPGITCTQCVLQWKWHGGNNWGKCRNGTSATGCGPQMEFYNCADISILSNSVLGQGGMQRRRQSLSNAMRNNMLVSNAVVSLARQNNPTPTKLFTPNEIVMSNALRKELQSLSRPNTQSSAILNGILARPSTSTRASMPLGVPGGTQAPPNLIKSPSTTGSRVMQNNPISPLLASILGRGNGYGFGLPMLGVPNMSGNNLMASQSSGMSTAEYLAARALATTLLGQNSVNQNMQTDPTSGRSSSLENLLLAMALNPNRNSADYLKLAMLAPLLQKQISRNNVQTGLKTDTRPMQNGSLTTNVTMNTQTQPTVVPTESSNYLQQLLISQLFPSLGHSGLAAEFGLNLPGISRSRSGGEEGSQARRTMAGIGGEEASEGGSRSRSSMLGGNLGMSQQLLLLASLLGENRRGVAERQFPTPPFAANVPGMFGSQGLGHMLGGTFGRQQQMSLTPELIMLSSMFGRNRRGGGEGSEGGGESGLFGSMFGRGGAGGGERSEGRSAGGNMAGMSPMIAYMLQQNLGMGLGGQMKGGLPSPLLGAALGGQKPMGLNTPFSMLLFGANKALSQIGGQSRNPLMSLMRTRNSGQSLMSPNMSMLDIYRLFGFGGRRGTRRID